MWGAVLSNNAIHHHTGSKKIARAQAQPPAAPRHRALGQALGPQPRPGAGAWPGTRGLWAGGLGLGPSYLFGPSMMVNGVSFLTQPPSSAAQ